MYARGDDDLGKRGSVPQHLIDIITRSLYASGVASHALTLSAGSTHLRTLHATTFRLWSYTGGKKSICSCI
jgi:hypothetical protein